MIVKNLENKEHSTVSFDVVIDAAAFEKAINAVYLKNKKNIFVQGFRKGKAPRMVVEGFYGKDVFYEDAAEELAPEAFEFGAAESKLRTVGRPSMMGMNVSDDKELTLSFVTAIWPEVKLGEYKGVSAPKKAVEVTDEMVEDELRKVQRRNARIATADRPAKDGDTAIIDYAGTMDGVAFDGGTDTNHGLVLGSGIALVFTFIYYMLRRVVSFKDFMGCFPEGFKAMVPAMLILTLAWALGSTTKYNLGSTDFVQNLLANADTLKNFLPVILFMIACFIAFSTGTSWGTFGIMIPIVCSIYDSGSPYLTIAIAAAMGGAVMGDHCSPISDTTIMASAGGHCDHVNHVSTQLPYAVTVAVCCAIGYLISAFTTKIWIILPAAIIIELIVLFVIRGITSKKDA